MSKNKLKKLAEIYLAPVTINQKKYSITASIGVSISPLHGNNINDLCRDADIAMHQAKEKGKIKLNISKSI